MDEKLIVNRINVLCEERGWSKQQLAEVSGVEYDTLHSILSGDTAPSIASIEKLCHALGVSLSCFFAEREEFLRLTKEQKCFLELYGKLKQEDKEKAIEYIDGLLKEKTDEQ